MACAAQHAGFNLMAGTVVGLAAQHHDGKAVDAKPLALGLAAAALPSLPDLLEPALHPNHRKFFHSISFAVGLAYGVHRVYRWEPESELEQLMRLLLLVGGTAYLGHLALDAFSAKSLPLV
jgi:inner membrane protein